MYITCNVISIYRSGVAKSERKEWEIGLDFLINFYDQAEETNNIKKRKHEEAARAGRIRKNSAGNRWYEMINLSVSFGILTFL